MQENLNQPGVYDAVLGSQSTPTHDAVLGGVDGVKSRLASQVTETRVAALKESLNYAETGLSLIISALQDESDELKLAAYLLLQQQKNIKARQAVQGFDHWQLLKCLRTFQGYASVISIPISSDGKKIYLGGYDKIRICNLRTGICQIRTLQEHSGVVEFLVIGSDEQRIIGGIYQDDRIKTWDFQTGEILSSLTKKHSTEIHSIALCKDNQTIIIGSITGAIRVYNLKRAVLPHPLCKTGFKSPGRLALQAFYRK